jgi:ribonuclease Z
MRIFISHMHGDHVFGLPGLLHSLSFMGRTAALEIIGPKGINDFVTSVNRTVKLYSRFPMRIKEVRSGKVVDDKEYEINAAPGEHGMPCLSYALVEKPRVGKFYPSKARKLGIPEGPLWKKLQTAGSVRVGKRVVPQSLVVGPPRRGVKLTYAVDTRPCDSIVKLAAKSDLLIHDSCFAEAASTKARDYGHSTASEAAWVAKKSGSRKLALFHISAMYEDPAPLLAEAKRIFRRTVLPSDMTTVYVSPEPRG